LALSRILESALFMFLTANYLNGYAYSSEVIKIFICLNF